MADRDETDTARGATQARGPAGSGDDQADAPTELNKSSWFGVLKRTIKEFQEDNLTDWAAALTYYGVLSLFPGLLVLISLLGLIGESVTDPVLDNVTGMAPDPVRSTLTNTINDLQKSAAPAGFLAIAGLLGALWSASGYIGAFMRASNAIYDVPEGRPIWKTLPIRLGITIVVGVLIVVSALIVVLTGDLAERIGEVFGVGKQAVDVWDIAKWPVLVILVSLMFALLYWASPNAKLSGFRWVSPGGLLAVLIWLIASGAFAFYVSNFGNYNKTYGALGGVIIFLVWLWISNIAILLGAEFDAELHRGKAIQEGRVSDDDEPFLPLRDDSKIKKGADQDLK